MQEQIFSVRPVWQIFYFLCNVCMYVALRYIANVCLDVLLLYTVLLYTVNDTISGAVTVLTSSAALTVNSIDLRRRLTSIQSTLNAAQKVKFIDLRRRLKMNFPQL